MLGHDQGSRRPLRGQPVTRRSAGRGGKAWGDGRSPGGSQPGGQSSPTMAYQFRGGGVERAWMISCACGRVHAGRARVLAPRNDKYVQYLRTNYGDHDRHRWPVNHARTIARTGNETATKKTTSVGWCMSDGWVGWRLDNNDDDDHEKAAINSTKLWNNGSAWRHLIPFPGAWPSPAGHRYVSKHVAELKVFKSTIALNLSILSTAHFY